MKSKDRTSNIRAIAVLGAIGMIWFGTIMFLQYIAEQLFILVIVNDVGIILQIFLTSIAVVLTLVSLYLFVLGILSGIALLLYYSWPKGFRFYGRITRVMAKFWPLRIVHIIVEELSKD
ncbi:MAG TPA: hypothetical protein VFM68_02870 [Candidatus Saccharimonadales bacterium]|nr:hypothetical protein [Candidatus Saccharimonadales bacterium]